MNQVLLFDWETRSTADLRKLGVVEYARHESTEILCLAFRWAPRAQLREATTKIWCPHLDRVMNGIAWNQLIRALEDPDTLLVGHNVLFEAAITTYVLPRYLAKACLKLPPIATARWACTAAQSAMMALPRSLDGSARAMGLPVEKDREGHRLMMKMAKPRKLSKKNTKPWNDDPADFERLIAYCAKDVEVETEIFLRLPQLPPAERKVFELDMVINQRGFAVDQELIGAALDIVAKETAAMDLETAERTLGLVTSMRERDAALAFLRSDDLDLPNLQAKTVETALLTEMDENPKALLEIRQAISKSSTAKYAAFHRRSRSDGRVRDILKYHGASTGRFSSTGAQIQNLPKGTVKAPIEELVAAVKVGDPNWLRLMYGEPFAALASAIRGVIVATGGRTFYCSDFNAIEARGLFWIAGHEDGLQAFRDGRDLYVELATDIYKISAEKVDGEQRFLAKTATLGCGYGLGWKKFQDSCTRMGAPVSDDLAQRCVTGFRELHAPVPKLWRGLERAAIHATRNRGTKTAYGRIQWIYKEPFLYCRLPSGRCLSYYKAQVSRENSPFGERDVLGYWGVNSRTKQWELQRSWGGLLAENCVQALCRDLLVDAMLRIEAAGYEIVLTVHDEILAEREGGDLEEFNALMSELPEWAAGLPVKVAGWKGNRYKK